MFRHFGGATFVFTLPMSLVVLILKNTEKNDEDFPQKSVLSSSFFQAPLGLY
jgi:hypothetical protein